MTTSYEQLPVVLKPKDLKLVFPGMGLNTIYNLMHRKDFPKILIGGRFYVAKKELINWLDKQAEII